MAISRDLIRAFPAWARFVVVELGLIGDLPAPGLPTAEPRRTIWLPKDGDEPLPDRANKIPLPTTEMTRTGHERNLLVEAAKLDTKPALVFAAHVRANHAGGNFAPI